MLRIRVVNRDQTQEYDHEAGPVELGRGLQREVRRIQIADPAVSRDQLRIEELPGGRVRLENLSQTKAIKLPAGEALEMGASRECSLPVSLGIHHVRVYLEAAQENSFEQESLRTIAQPAKLHGGRRPNRPAEELTEALTPELIAQWLETVLTLQRSAVDSAEFYEQTARAVVELIGLDAGMVLLRRDQAWAIVARHASGLVGDLSCSRTLVDYVVARRRTFYQDLGALNQSASLVSVEAAVVSPIFGLQDEVAGLVYGVRGQGAKQSRIRPLEAQLVQLLAAAVGSHLARTSAIRTRVQFEQFFSPELVRELERNPDLLEGRDQEVTILVSDLRGYTSLSQRLDARTTCRLVRDLMERLSGRITEQGGVIIDYAGDGILAMWNAPAAQPDHASRACRAALAMLAELPALNADWQSVVGVPLVVGIGLNTGTAQVGNTGSQRKLKYGPHGHTVNLASRIQDATKRLGVPVLLTEAVRAQLPASLLTRDLGTVELAGIADSIRVFGLEGEAPPISIDPV